MRHDANTRHGPSKRIPRGLIAAVVSSEHDSLVSSCNAIPVMGETALPHSGREALP
jgi:hypothetical protein